MGGNTIAIAGPSAARKRKTSRPGRGRLRLRRNVPLRDALLAAFSGVLLSARRSASGAAEKPVESVHDFRKSIRRARSVVALLRPALGRTAADGLVEELRRAFRDTNDLRDGDVLTTTLASLSDEDPELFVEAAEVAARLGAAPAESPDRILGEAIPILRRLPAALEVTLPRQYSTPDLETGLERSYRRAQRAWIAARQSGAEVDFHSWRKRLKELRYQLELLASTGSRSLKIREKPLGDFARELGEVTDLAVLCGQIEALGGGGAGGDAVLGGRLLERARAVVKERSVSLLTRGEAFFAETPHAFALKVLAERG